MPASFNDDGPFVLLHPFSRGAGKSLSAEEVETFCGVLGGTIVLAGRSEVSVPEIRSARVINLLNQTTISQLIWLIRKARFVVSVDSGPMHIAAAITPNLLSIHTWSDPALVGPYNPDAWVWKERTLCQMRDLRISPAKKQAAPDIESIASAIKGMLAK
jgi:ADP-heptose:LPS heptosyltransferase